MNQLDYIPVNFELQKLITPETAWHYGVVPKIETELHLEFYIDKEKSSKILNDELEIFYGKKIILHELDSLIIQKTLSKFFRINSEVKLTRGDLNVKSGDFLFDLIREAKSLGSSDIHVEIYDDICRIRVRVDGLLIERFSLSKLEYPTVINKIKIQANCEISEKRLPQDGRIRFNKDGFKIDIRVSILPTLHGEKIVLRLLSNDTSNIELSKLGLLPDQLEVFQRAISKPHGIILISGPTGSGKTTTLYATLKNLNKSTRNIMTVEDPIEYTLEGINQVQMREEIGLTFASALKSFLRQDPDIIMVGEIRDAETAQMAIRASLTGHLVLSTIHTNSAWGTISRLVDIGIPPYLVSNSLNLSVAQRLVRLLCTNCKRKHTGQQKTINENKIIYNLVYEPVGCELCHFTGYKGRIAIYEVIYINDVLSECIRTGQQNISELQNKMNIRSLAESALELLHSGQTSLEEAFPLINSVQ